MGSYCFPAVCPGPAPAPAPEALAAAGRLAAQGRRPGGRRAGPMLLLIINIWTDAAGRAVTR